MEGRSRSEMDIMPAFEAVVGGSNPSGSTFDSLTLAQCKHRSGATVVGYAIV